MCQPLRPKLGQECAAQIYAVVQTAHTAAAAATAQKQKWQLGHLLWGLAAAGALAYGGVQQGRAADERLNPGILCNRAWVCRLLRGDNMLSPDSVAASNCVPCSDIS